ncbi:hypothetical protein F7725_024992 [Dissostichus mawsoni]|uniref:Uncharacterized protein n=1 Tax=Dissostichus mawsoni TaxID=36200 RepID=A0A7J5XBJ6_DISMA|nr:hypothetical protein F7725_024992 [Dissostichus mawsoni]
MHVLILASTKVCYSPILVLSVIHLFVLHKHFSFVEPVARSIPLPQLLAVLQTDPKARGKSAEKRATAR